MPDDGNSAITAKTTTAREIPRMPTLQRASPAPRVAVLLRPDNMAAERGKFRASAA